MGKGPVIPGEGPVTVQGLPCPRASEKGGRAEAGEQVTGGRGALGAGTRPTSFQTSRSEKRSPVGSAQDLVTCPRTGS